MKNKKILSIFSTVLTLILLLSSIPLSQFVTFATEEAKASEAVKVSLFDGLKEDPAMRDRFTKHYYDKNGTYYAVVYPEQIHYVEDGQWADVDNTLRYDLKTASYVNENPKFSFGFAANSESSNLVTISDGSYTLSWSVRMNSTADDRIKLSENELQSFEVSINKSASAVISAAVSNKKATPEDLTSEIKAVSGIRYSGVLNNEVDLRYTAYHGKIEEDVILNEKGTFESYTMTVNTDGLTATVADDSSVVFTNAEGKTVFTIAAPWMSDANGEMSDDITVSITQIRNTAYITYTPSAEWLSDDNRAYPVLIDPSVTSRYYTNNYQDTYVASGDSTSYASQRYMFVGNKSSKNIKALVKIINMPEILGSANVGEAKFNFWLTDTSNPTLKISHANSAWNASTVTYANCPTGTFIDSGTRLKTEVSDVEEDPYEVDSFVSYSRYSYNITNWLNNVSSSNGYEYFFEYDWNGFIIEYNTLTTGQNVRIWSSEHTEAKFRPTITFKYEFEQNECLEDEAIYSISNVKTGKFLTVAGDADANGTNVYQQTKNGMRSQAFRLDYNPDSEAFRLRAMCSSDGANRVLNMSFESTIDPSTGYTPTNLELNTLSSMNPEKSEWLFVHTGGHKYKIVSAYDPRLAITACYGTNVISGSSVMYAENIAVAEYTGMEQQHWYIESGGITMTEASVNMKLKSTAEATVGTSTSKLFYPINVFGEKVEYYTSSKTSVASVNDAGEIIAVNPGSTNIGVVIIRDDDSTYTPNVSVTLYSKLTNGVYTLQCQYSGGYLESPNGNVQDGTQYILWDETTNNNSRFKVVYLGEGKYVLRSMRASNRAVAVDSQNRVVSQKITTNDTLAWVPTNAQWIITDGSYGYELQNVATGLYLEGEDYDTGYESLVTGDTYADNDYQCWEFVKLNTVSQGLTIVNKVSSLAVGEEYDIEVAYYSSIVGDNYCGNERRWSVQGSGNATISLGRITPTSEGNITVTVRDIINNWTDSFNLDIKKRAIIIIPGIMSSQLFADGNIYVPPTGVLENGRTFLDGTRLWDPLSSLDVGYYDEKITALAMSSAGGSVYAVKTQLPTINEYDKTLNDFKYGTMDMYRNLYNELYENFYGSTYDIVLYEYDWRKDPFVTANELNAFINEQDYGKVVFVSHSMGGLVSSYYLSLGKEQRNLVEKHISVGTPYLGSVEMPKMFSSGKIFGIPVLENMFTAQAVLDVIYNFASVYSLFIFEQEWQSYLSYRSAPDAITHCTTYSQTMNALSTYLENWNATMAEQAIDNHSRMFSLSGDHITTSVDSYYIVGDGETTTYSIIGLFDNLVNPSQFNDFTFNENTLGDGTVTLHSATIGGTTPSDRTFYQTGSSGGSADHNGMIDGKDNDYNTINFIVTIINNELEDFSASQLETEFGIETR